ncbi:MAG: site-specific integrase [Kiritimatiellae bacterium]|nr:site-specific integrase [Kiritimatiellia bacterium]
MKGTIYNNNGKWYYAVRLPGEKKRKAYPLKAAGHDVALSADRPRELAIQAAWRIWENASKRKPTTTVEQKTVESICAAYCEHAQTYYRRADGEQTSEVHLARLALRVLRDIYGSQSPAALTHADMLHVREVMASDGTLSRTTVNAYMARMRRMWTWALDAAMISATVKAELTQVQPLKPNRTQLREPVPVMPVSDADIEKTKAAMPENVADMVAVHRLTGMRPEEVCAMRWQFIDTTATPWVYRPPFHKTQWRGMIRAVLIGPRARKILKKYRDGNFDGCPFAPARVIANPPPKGIHAHLPVKRGTACWNTGTYTFAVRSACVNAKVDEWTPNRLRHSFATDIRKKHGIRMAGALLGHSDGSRITDGYSREAAVDELVRECGAVIEAEG